MAPLELTLRLLSGIFLLLANGMFVTTEFALTRLRQFQKEDMGDSSSLNLAWEMTEELEIYLTACQLGITVTSILLGVTFEPGVTHLILPITTAVGLTTTESSFVAVAISVVVIQFMHTVWGEQSPTYLGVEKPLLVAKIFAPILYGWSWLCHPIIYFGDHMAKWTLAVFGITLHRSWTEEETIDSQADLRREMGNLLSKGELPDERRDEVINALEIDEMTTKEIMVPRQDIKSLSTEQSIEKNIEVLANNSFSRFPLIESDLDDPIGIIYVPSLLPVLDQLREGELSLDEIAVEPMIVEAERPVSELVDRFQDERQELAFVREDGEIIGLVTSTDAFESVMGELKDPFD
jgi:CBS domain containing-hemolysin-like protein